MTTRVLTADNRWRAVGGSAGASTAGLEFEFNGTTIAVEDWPGRAEKLAVANPWVLAAWLARSRPLTMVPINVYERLGPKTRQRIHQGDAHPAAALARILGRTADPARRTSAMRLLSLVARDKMLHGDAFARQILTGSRLDALRWVSSTKIVPVKIDEVLQAYRIGDTYIDPSEIVHWRDHERGDGILGRSPLESLEATNELHDLATKFAQAFMQNGTFPSGWVEVEAGTTPEQLKITRQLIKAAHTGLRNAGNAMIGYGKWHRVSSTPEAAKLVELSRASREEVSGAFSVPMSVLGDARDTNKATAGEDWLRFLRNVVGGDVEQISAELDTQLVEPRFPGVEINPQMFSLLRPDVVKMAEVINKEVGGPVATANEGRGWIGLEPLDDPMADRLILNPGTPGHDDDTDDADGDESGDE